QLRKLAGHLSVDALDCALGLFDQLLAGQLNRIPLLGHGGFEIRQDLRFLLFDAALGNPEVALDDAGELCALGSGECVTHAALLAGAAAAPAGRWAGSPLMSNQWAGKTWYQRRPCSVRTETVLDSILKLSVDAALWSGRRSSFMAPSPAGRQGAGR